jgi:hypothetical protein
MASPFVVAENDVIEELKTSGESTNLWVGDIRKWQHKEHRRRHGNFALYD